MRGPPFLGMRGCQAQPRILCHFSQGAVAEPCATEHALSAAGVKRAAALGHSDLDGVAPSGSAVASPAKQPLQRVQRGVRVTCSSPHLRQSDKRNPFGSLQERRLLRESCMPTLCGLVLASGVTFLARETIAQ